MCVVKESFVNYEEKIEPLLFPNTHRNSWTAPEQCFEMLFAKREISWLCFSLKESKDYERTELFYWFFWCCLHSEISLMLRMLLISWFKSLDSGIRNAWWINAVNLNDSRVSTAADAAAPDTATEKNHGHNDWKEVNYADSQNCSSGCIVIELIGVNGSCDKYHEEKCKPEKKENGVRDESFD